MSRQSLTRRKSVYVPKDKDNGWKTVGTPTEIALQVIFVLKFNMFVELFVNKQLGGSNESRIWERRVGR